MGDEPTAIIPGQREGEIERRVKPSDMDDDRTGRELLRGYGQLASFPHAPGRLVCQAVGFCPRGEFHPSAIPEIVEE